MKKTISILGGSGFVGSHLVAELGKKGYRMRIASRHPERHRHLSVVPNVSVHKCNILSYELNDFLNGSDIVINLIGVLNEEKRGDFIRYNTDFPASVAQACQTLGIYRMIHMSALGADAGFAPSEYLRSKGDGEANLQDYSGEIDMTVFRPNVIFGPGDHFFNRLAFLLKKIPFSFPLVSPYTRMAPVYVGDVCHAISRSIENRKCIGKSFDLCGPKIYQFRELVEYVARLCGSRKKISETGRGIAMMLASILERLPGKILTRDQLKTLSQDCLCEYDFPRIFDIEPKTIESVVPTYLGQSQKPTYYDHLRARAGR